MIRSVSIKNFTAFQHLQLTCSPGINVFLGRNSTGKSHVLKLMYATCATNALGPRDTADTSVSLTRKLAGVFKPENNVGRLCREGAEKAEVDVQLVPDRQISFAFSGEMREVVVTANRDYATYKLLPVFIPPKEMLSSFPGFSSLYSQRELSIDETYFDLCQALETPALRDDAQEHAKELLAELKAACGGEFLLVKQQRFYFKPNGGRLLEVDLAAEGFRKLGMLQRLLQNGRIRPGFSGPLFWDEPETNLNPTLMRQMVSMLLALSRAGQQVMIATHDYVLLKWLDLLLKPEDAVAFHALYRDDSGNIAVNSTYDYAQIAPNAIDDAFAELVNGDVQRAMKGCGQ
jgi:hypothetical protein